MPEKENDHELPWDPSFNLKKLRRILASDDPLQIVVRGHLYIEHILINFIQIELRHPDAFSLDRLSFPMKVDLAIALGIVHPTMKSLLLMANTLRNRLAHDLEYEPTDDDKMALFRTLPPVGQQLALTDPKDRSRKINNSEVTIANIYKVIVVLLDTARHEHKEWREQKETAERKLREAVDNLDNLTSVADDDQ